MTEKELHGIFSNNIKELRNRFHWSQVTLAQKTGVSVNFINDIEAKKKWASPATMVKIANVFNVQVYELLRPSGQFPDNLNSIIRKYTDDVHKAIENTQVAFMQDKSQ